MRGFTANMSIPTACAIAADMIGKIARDAITVGAHDADGVRALKKCGIPARIQPSRFASFRLLWLSETQWDRG